MHKSDSATAALRRLRRGEAGAADLLLPVVYGELRKQARRLLRRERRGHTLQPTELVHEAYLRLIDQREVDWRDRAHFIAFATTVMRRVLTDRARRRGAQKRGQNVTLDVNLARDEGRDAEVLEFEAALTRLAELDPRRAEVAALRVIGGLTTAEIAEVQEVSTRTVERDWRAARAWLMVELRPSRPG